MDRIGINEIEIILRQRGFDSYESERMAQEIMIQSNNGYDVRLAIHLAHNVTGMDDD